MKPFSSHRPALCCRIELGLLAVLLSLCASCGNSDLEVSDWHDVSQAKPSTVKNKERFAAPRPPAFPFRSDLTTCSSGNSAPADPAPPLAITPQSLTYALPAGWRIDAPSPMRNLAFTFGEASEGHCFVKLMPGKAGDLPRGINRWRRQMALPPLTDQEITALPEIALAGGKGRLIELTGVFSGINSAPEPSFELLAAIKPAAHGMLSVKMTGPERLVREERQRFIEFCASVKLRE